LSETQKALDLSDKDKRRAEQALKQAHNETERAKQAREQARIDSQERYRAEEQARKVKQATEHSKMTYKSFFIGQMIFTLALAYFVAYSKRSVLKEMKLWFPSRWQNIKSFASWITIRYMAAIKLIQVKWDIENWAHLIVIIISLILLVALFFIVRFLIIKIVKFISSVRFSAEDIILKDIISGDIILISLYICLFFYEPIKNIIPINIFSIWLIFSFLGIGLWNVFEIKQAIKYKW